MPGDLPVHLIAGSKKPDRAPTLIMDQTPAAPDMHGGEHET
jgi:hypothetical protein